MNEVLIQFIASNKKRYPGGIPKRSRAEAITKPRCIVFLLNEEPTREVKELLVAAAEKGLLLKSSQYTITTSEDRCKDNVVIAMGKMKHAIGGAVKVIATVTPEEILHNATDKKKFWDDIKTLKGTVHG